MGALAAIVVALAPALSTAGKLGDTADLVGSSGDNDDGDSDWCLFSCGDDDDDNVASAPAHTSYLEIDFRYRRHPYADGQPGYAITETRIHDVTFDSVIETTVDPPGASLDDGRLRALLIDMGYQYDWDGLHLASARLHFAGAGGWGLAGGWLGFFEPLGRRVDTMHIADLALEGTVYASSGLVARIDGGGLLMHHGDDTHPGLYGGARVDVFPGRPFVLSGSMMAGWLNAALYTRVRGSVGAIVGPFEVYAGYDWQLFGTEDDEIVFHGLVGGIRFWL